MVGRVLSRGISSDAVEPDFRYGLKGEELSVSKSRPLRPTKLTSVRGVATSLMGRYCCKSRFSPMTKILRAVDATFAYKMRGTSRPHAKFTGDFGSAIEVIRISDRSLLSVFAKNLEPCNFRLLQHNRPIGDTDYPAFGDGRDGSVVMCTPSTS